VASGLNDIIASLEEQKSAIERALSALRQIEGSGVQCIVSFRQGCVKVFGWEDF